MKHLGTADWWRELVRTAVRAQTPPPGPHVADDDELLAAWSAGLLAPPAHQTLVEHLSRCAACREEVVELLNQGVLEFAEPRARPHRRALTWWLPAGLAAALLLVAIGVWFLLPTGDPVLVRAAEDLDAGRAEAAWQQLDAWLDAPHAEADRQRARRLLEQAGYALARADLSGKRFQAVRDRVARLAERGVVSGRLRNLALQAEHAAPVEVALAGKGALLAYGYEPDGNTPGKALPVPDDRLERQWQQALEEFPGEPLLLVNYGQFLFAQERFDEARERFAAALAADERLPAALLGLGLVAYQGQDYQAALDRFESLLRLTPDSVEGHVNVAMCLERLGRGPEARPHWQQAADATDNAVWRRKIRRHLQEKAPPPQ
jgi:tetratricopeptide (TPR) repeat protein